MLCDLDDPGVAVGLIPGTTLHLRRHTQHLNIMIDHHPQNLNMLSCTRVRGQYWENAEA